MPFFRKNKNAAIEAFTGTEDDGELVQQINGKVATHHQLTHRTRRQWMLNAAFFRGQQFMVLCRNEDRLFQLQAPHGRKQVMDNLMGPWKDQIIANMTMATPVFEGVPTTNDADSVSAARMGSKLLNFYWEDWNFILQFIQLNGYLVDFGNAFVFVDYKENTGTYETDAVKDIDTGDTVFDNEGNPIQISRPKDDIIQKVLMPHSVLCNLDVSPIEEKPWVIIKQRREMDYFRNTYENGDEVNSEPLWTTNGEMDAFSIQRISDIGCQGTGVDLQNYANEIIYMQKPSDSNPEGLVAVVANNVLLIPKKGKSRNPWPYKKLMTYPIEHFHFPKESGEFFARSRGENQIPLQKSLNLLWSIIIENAESAGHLKWLIPDQGNVTKISDINQIVRYTFPFKPEIASLQPLPDFISGSVIDRLKSAIRDVQNFHGASMGGAVSGVRSDAHAQNLQDQDLLPLTTVDNIVEQSFARLGEKILLIAASVILLPPKGILTDFNINCERSALNSGVHCIIAGAYLFFKKSS